ncbi:pentatricopeptide repeat-containing protein At5g40400 [Impatiens glandulifera]|uniref:pentatricopeptide repeat-containing protein At5g40400 n=1 Tax=Impatiens glandulifera TaxID=253017 RepID=UPI001FB135A3|nr:pentatricopeptide repeat-containing protein At5g40400 [Impatiens glandulifera]
MSSPLVSWKRLQFGTFPFLLIRSYRSLVFRNCGFLSSINFSSFQIQPSSSCSYPLIQDEDSKPKALSNPLYSFLSHAENPNNTVDIICSILRNDTSSLLNIQEDEALKRLIPHLHTHEVSRVLLRCQSDYSKARSFFNWVKNDVNLKLSTHNYCIMVHISAWSKKLSEAMPILSELVETSENHDSKSIDVFRSLVSSTDECNWDPVVFDMLIKAYINIGLVEKGWMALKMMVKLGFLPRIVTFNCLLIELSKQNCTKECWDLFEKMSKIGIHPNSHTFNIMTNVFSKHGDADKINEFLERIEEEGFIPDIVTYNTLIDCYCKRGRVNDAFYLYRIMYRRNVLPDLFSYTSLMNGLCKESRLREAHQLLHQMVHRGLTLDDVAYNTLISGYCKMGKMKESRALMHEMIATGIQPNSFTCLVLVEGYVNRGRSISALNVLWELQRFGIFIPREIYDLLISKLCLEKRPLAAKRLIERTGHVPGEPMYKEMIISLCDCGYIEEAMEAYKDLVKVNQKPDLQVYEALLGCLCKVGRSVEGESMMREFGQCNTGICRALIDGLCKERKVEKAQVLLFEFAEEFQIRDTECLNYIFRVLSEGEEGNVGEVLQFHEKVQKMGFIPNRLTMRYMIDALSIGKLQHLAANRECSVISL